mgnify:FL=1
MTILVRRRGVYVEHGVMEIGVRVPSGTASEPLIAFTTSEKGDVLDEMRQSLFVGEFVYRPHVHFQVRLEPAFRYFVRQDDVL